MKKLIIAADEFYKDPEFAICGVGLYENQMISFNHKWERLRGKIKNQLIRDSPRLINHPALINGSLPEIHAVDMIQSTSYYRLSPADPGYREGYWKRQQDWVKEALQIIASFDPKIFLYPKRITNEEIQSLRKMAEELYIEEVLKIEGVSIAEKRKIKLFGHLYSSPYHRNLPYFLLGIDDYLSEMSFSAEMIFDEFDNSKGFHDEDVLQILRGAGRIKSDFVSREDSSRGHNILQAADVVSYICSRDRFNAFENDPKLGDYFHKLGKRYIYPHSISHRRIMSADALSSLFLRGAVIFGPCKPKGLTGRTVEDLFKELIEGAEHNAALEHLREILDDTNPK